MSPPHAGPGAAPVEATAPLELRAPGVDANSCLLTGVGVLFACVPLIMGIRLMPIGEGTKMRVLMGLVPLMFIAGLRVAGAIARRDGGAVLHFIPQTGEILVNGRPAATFSELEAIHVVDEHGGSRLALQLFARSTLLSHKRPREVIQAAERRVRLMAEHQGVELSLRV